MLRNAALVLLAVCSGHFKETITETRERSVLISRSESEPAVQIHVLVWDCVVRQKIGVIEQRSTSSKMLAPCLLRRAVLTVPLVFVVALLLTEPVRSDQEAGTAIPAESRPCVDCHAFEFMQRALQDLKKTAYNLDTRTETLLLQVEKRNLCDCVTANLLN
ncbi:neuropeptide-like protein C4orf48 homolog [Falco rusticolus]|nr:neuropeptide-like protein C4orf48 homolog [Falco rusticolus]